jgi:hypothetical protein
MLLKAKTKRRRSKMEIMEEKEKELEKLREEIEKDREIAQLRNQLELESHKVAQMQPSKQLVDEMLRTGRAKINEEGEFLFIE